MHLFYAIKKKCVLLSSSARVHGTHGADGEGRAPASDFPSPKPPLKRMAEASGHPTGRTAFYSG